MNRSFFIIDNHVSVRNSLITVLKDFTSLVSVGNASTNDSAMNAILKNRPDFVFLDLDDTLERPFQFVKELNSYLDRIPDFIAISSSYEYTYNAIKHGFIDYILNPISELEVRKCILKYQKNREANASQKICLQSYKDYRYINTDEILFLKADNNTTDFYISSGDIVSAYKTLKVFENTLPENFVRIHKSYIVNKKYVSRINYGKYKCFLTNNTVYQLPFTKTYISNIDNIKDTLSYISLTNLN